MIPEIDIWRAAQLMLKRKALEESAARADELALAGDADGATTWRRIVAAVTELANKVPLAGPLSDQVSLRDNPVYRVDGRRRITRAVLREPPAVRAR